MLFFRKSYLLLALSFVSCEGEQAAPFTTGSRFSYATEYTSAEGRITKYDTLHFTVEPQDITNYNSGFKKIKWENTRHDYFQYRNLEIRVEATELQLPLNYAGFNGEYIAVAGHPLALMSVPEGRVFNEQRTYGPAYGALDSTTIFHKTKYIGDTSVLFDGEMLNCKLYEKHNSTQIHRIGQYKLRYTYNMRYGFITMEYLYPTDKHISLRLVDVSIKEPNEEH